MPTSDRSQRDSREIAEALDRALEEVRQEFQERLRQTREEIEGLMGRSPEEAASAVEGLARGEVGEARADGGMLDAVRAIDRGRSQAAVLSALLDTAAALAPRAALILTTSAGFRCWEARGFEPAAEAGEELWAGEGWRKLASGRGAVALEGEEAAALTGEANAAVAIPLVLGDRLAAALYAELPAGGAEAGGLQLLTYVAGLAIETLAFRARESTPTLRHEAEAGSHEPGLALWEAEGTTTQAAGAGADTGATAPMAEAEDEVGVPLRAEAPAEPGAAEDDLEPSSPEAFGLQLDSAQPEDSGEETVPRAPREEDDTFIAATRLTPPAEPREPRPEPADEAGGQAEEEPPAPAVGTPEAGTDTTRPGTGDPAPDDTLPGDAAEVASEADLAAPPLGAEEPPAMEVAATPEPEAPPPTAPSEGADEAGAAATPASVETDGSRAPERAGPAAAATSPAEGEGKSPRKATAGDEPAAGARFEVRPPADVRGPGRAFARGGRPASSAEAAHDEARRLARLLVSEIKLYNEDEVKRGRQEGRLLELLGDEIERSRAVYEERVDDAVRSERDHFDDELVRILADGDRAALGADPGS